MAFPADWGRKCELVFQSGQVTETLANYPALITKDTLPSEIFDADGSYPALNGGGDIRFSSNADGSTQLPCEIEQFVTDNDPANGKASIWVKVASLASASNTSIWIWYNKSGETQPAEGDTYGKHAVWDANYKMLQHMNQDPSGSAPQMIDSTVNSNDGTSNGTMLTEDLVDGKIGKCLEFDGSDDYINCDVAAADVGTSGTISMWINPASNSGSFYPYSSREGDWGDKLDIKYNWGDIQVRWINTIYDTGVNAVVGNWNRVTLTWSGTTLSAYIDGALIDSYSDVTIDQLTQMDIGRYVEGSARFPGKIDEVMLSNTARSAGWIGTGENNHSSPSTFIIEGTPETPGGGAATAPTGVFYGPLYGPFMGAIG